MIKNVFLILLISFTFISCKELCSLEEVERVTSPDNKVDAVIIKKNYGATASFIYDIYIVPKGKKVDLGKPEFRADHVEKLSLNWSQNKLLQIKYKNARIFHFSNFWQSKEVDNFSYVVEIQLKPLSKDFSLSEEDRWVK